MATLILIYCRNTFIITPEGKDRCGIRMSARVRYLRALAKAKDYFPATTCALCEWKFTSAVSGNNPNPIRYSHDHITKGCVSFCNFCARGVYGMRYHEFGNLRDRQRGSLQHMSPNYSSILLTNCTDATIPCHPLHNPATQHWYTKVCICRKMTTLPNENIWPSNNLSNHWTNCWRTPHMIFFCWV